jgi:hypothetical protein
MKSRAECSTSAFKVATITHDMKNHIRHEATERELKGPLLFIEVRTLVLR